MRRRISDLARAVADDEFRDDLYYRLSVFPIRLPSLRERREDIPALVWFIIHKRQRAMRHSVTSVPAHVMDALQNHSWPGNVRELENVIERALIHSPGEHASAPRRRARDAGVPPGRTTPAR